MNLTYAIENILNKNLVLFLYFCFTKMKEKKKSLDFLIQNVYIFSRLWISTNSELFLSMVAREMVKLMI